MPSFVRYASSSIMIVTFCPPHSGTGVVVFNSIAVYEPSRKRWFERRGGGHTTKIDTGSKCVSLVPDRMRIDHCFDPELLHISHRGVVDFKATGARFDVREQRILKSICIRQSFLQSLRNIFLALSQHISHLLPIGAQAHVIQTTVDVNNITALDNG